MSRMQPALFCCGSSEVPHGNCKAEVISDTPASVEKEIAMRYIGLIEGPHKKRYTSHTSDMTTRKPRSGTTLSRHVWDLKDQNIPFKISWSIRERCKS